MEKERKNRLLELGPDVLADALLKLECRSEEASDLIDRLLATPEDAIKSFKAQMSAIKRSRKFYDWREVGRFAYKLEDMLIDVQHNVSDPSVGMDLVTRFFGIANSVFERGDDSNGSLGDVYRYTATKVFTYFAKACPDQVLIENTLFDLMSENDNGECDMLLDEAFEYLEEEEMRRLIARFKERADNETDEFNKRHWLIPVETLASHLNDPVVYEESRLAMFDGEPGTAACLDIGAEYLKAGDREKALDWIEKVPTTESFMAHERDALLVRLYAGAGNQDKLEAAAWRIFRRHRSVDTLEFLLESVNEDKADIISKEKEMIFANPDFSITDTYFLIDCGEENEAERYVLLREADVNGDYYESVGELAKQLEKSGLIHAAMIAYRALLDSILKRGRTKAYYYGARYLKKLDTMAAAVEDWRGIENHEFYFESLKRDHGRKYSFWSKYEE